MSHLGGHLGTAGSVAAASITGTVALANGGTGAALVDPNADRILFWDDSAGTVTFLQASTGLTITTTSLTVNAADLKATAAEVTTGTEDAKFMTPLSYKTSTPYVVPRAAGWTLALTDRNTDQHVTSTATCQIPLNATVAFATYDVVSLLASGGAVTVTISAVSGVTLNGTDAGSCDIATAYQRVLLQKVGTDAWVISGDHTAVA